MSTRDAIDAIRPTVLQVSYVVPPGPVEGRKTFSARDVRRGILGTAFFVNQDGYGVTARHVVEAARKIHEQFPTAQVGAGLAVENSATRRANFVITGIKVVEEDREHDLALLKLRKNPFNGELRSPIQVLDEEVPLLHGVPRIRPERPRDGDPIAISGYPLGEPVLVTTSGAVASSWSVIPEDIPHPGMAEEPLTEMRDVYVADVQTNPGNSGGPVYSTEDAAVIGILVAGKLTDVRAGNEPASSVLGVRLTADAGLSLVTPARYLVDLLDRNQITYTHAE